MSSLNLVPAVSTESSTFVKPHFIAELGCEGLTLHEVAKSLGIEFKHAKEKIVRLIEANRLISQYAVYAANNENNRLVESYYLATDTAKFFVAKWDSHIGDAYTRFLIECEKVALAVPTKVGHLELASLMLEQMKVQEARLQIVEQQLVVQEAKQAEQCLSSTQIDALEALFSEFFRVTGRDGSRLGQLKKLIKCKFLSAPISGKTYKDIAYGKFPDVVKEIEEAIARAKV